MILDHIRFSAPFLDGRVSEELWSLAAIFENDEDVVVHRLTREEFDTVVAIPEVNPLGLVQTLTTRVAELQAIVDKRKDEREWDSVQELFHPDMNIADIKLAIASLIALHTEAKAGHRWAKPFGDAFQNATEKLWEGRPTQLEKDHAPVASRNDSRAESTTQHPERQQAVHAAGALWDLLDMIDSLGDEIKPSDLDGYKRFYRRATGIASLRSQYMASDGCVLLWPYRTRALVFEHKRSIVAPVARGQYDDLVDLIVSLGQGYTFETRFPKEHGAHAKLLSELFRESCTALRAPVPMLLHCPICHTKHIDEGEFATKAHHTHACQGFLPLAEGEQKPRRCGHVWRPAIVATVGVEALPGFLNDTIDGEALLGKRVRAIVNGFEGTIKSYSVSENTYLIASASDTRMLLRRHEFTVLPENEALGP